MQDLIDKLILETLRRLNLSLCNYDDIEIIELDIFEVVKDGWQFWELYCILCNSLCLKVIDLIEWDEEILVVEDLIMHFIKRYKKEVN
jgi:hypothetical protein